MTPYLNTLSPLTTEILTAFASKPSKDTELWRSVIAALTTSFQVDESGGFITADRFIDKC